MLTKLDVAY